MGSIHMVHVVCLLSLILGAWHAECKISQLSCSEQLGANTPSSPQVPDKGNEPQICVSKTNTTCCTRQTEDSLRVKAAKNIKTRLQTKYMAAKSSLLSLLDDLKGYFQSIMQESNQQSINFLLSTQPNITAAEASVISTFFRDLENYLADDKQELQDIVNTFFRSSFPLVLEYLNPEGKTVSSSYKQCLKTNMDSIKPFGTRPAQLVGIFEQVFEPVRSLFKGLKFGVEVLSLAQQFNFTSGCKNVLLEMKFCSLCQGLSQVKPCHRFCMDTTRNCLISETQLQTKWGKLTDTIFSLAKSIGKSDLENFSNSIYKDLWSAATYVLIQKANIMSEVLDKCGQPTYIDAPSKPSHYTKSVLPTPHVKVRLFAKMEDVKIKVNALSLFFQELPQELCVVDELSAKQTNVDNCWNGKSVAKYETKPGASHMSSESKDYLRMLEKKMQEKITAIGKAIVESDDGNEVDESGSGSASGDRIVNVIDESGCGNDDEDCGSTSGENEIPTGNGDDENDFDFISTRPSPVNEIGFDSQAGGVSHTTVKPGNVLARENSSSTLTVPWLQILTLLLLVWLTRK